MPSQHAHQNNDSQNTPNNNTFPQQQQPAHPSSAPAPRQPPGLQHPSARTSAFAYTSGQYPGPEYASRLPLPQPRHEDSQQAGFYGHHQPSSTFPPGPLPHSPTHVHPSPPPSDQLERARRAFETYQDNDPDYLPHMNDSDALVELGPLPPPPPPHRDPPQRSHPPPPPPAQARQAQSQGRSRQGTSKRGPSSKKTAASSTQPSSAAMEDDFDDLGTGSGGRSQGAQNYSNSEMSMIAQLMLKHKPIGPAEWKVMLQEYNEWAEANGFTSREYLPMKSKWNKMAQMKPPTGSGERAQAIELALEAAAAIEDKAGGSSLQDDDGNDEVEVYDQPPPHASGSRDPPPSAQPRASSSRSRVDDTQVLTKAYRVDPITAASEPRPRRNARASTAQSMADTMATAFDPELQAKRDSTRLGQMMELNYVNHLQDENRRLRERQDQLTHENMELRIQATVNNQRGSRKRRRRRRSPSTSSSSSSSSSEDDDRGRRSRKHKRRDKGKARARTPSCTPTPPAFPDSLSK